MYFSAIYYSVYIGKVREAILRKKVNLGICSNKLESLPKSSWDPITETALAASPGRGVAILFTSKVVSPMEFLTPGQ